MFVNECVVIGVCLRNRVHHLPIAGARRGPVYRCLAQGKLCAMVLMEMSESGLQDLIAYYDRYTE